MDTDEQSLALDMLEEDEEDEEDEDSEEDESSEDEASQEVYLEVSKQDSETPTCSQVNRRF